jgi:hypothetical protein
MLRKGKTELAPCKPLRVTTIKRLFLETRAQWLLITGIRYRSQADYSSKDFLVD